LSSNENGVGQDPMQTLLVEYEQCNDGYNSRDNIAADEFTKLFQSIFGFLALLIVVNILTRQIDSLRILLTLIIGFLGFISFGALMVDMEEALTVKTLLRRRAREIEKTFQEGRGPVVWKLIEQRYKNKLGFREEKWLKKVDADSAEADKETEGVLFVYSV
jgi:hypothetical protein